jgi:hypothetical protein
MMVFAGAPLGVTVLGLKEHPDAGGRLLQLNWTLSVNPGAGVTVTVKFTGTPAVVVALAGLVATVSAEAPCAHPGCAMRQKKTTASHNTNQPFLIDMVNIFFLPN